MTLTPTKTASGKYSVNASTYQLIALVAQRLLNEDITVAEVDAIVDHKTLAQHLTDYAPMYYSMLGDKQHEEYSAGLITELPDIIIYAHCPTMGWPLFSVALNM